MPGAVCDHHLSVNTRDQELVKKRFLSMTPSQLDGGWHQNLTTTSLKALHARGRQVFVGRVLHQPDLHVANKRRRRVVSKKSRFFNIISHVPSAVTGMRMHKLIRNSIGPARAFPTMSLQVDDLGVVDVDARQILEEDADTQQEIRRVNRAYLDISYGLVAILVQLVPILIPIVASLGSHGLVRRKPS